MNSLSKIVFLFLIVFVLQACDNRPSKKILAVARVMNPNQIDEAITCIEKRMAKFAIEASIAKLNSTDVRIDITTKDETALLKSNLISSVKLEFYETVPAGWITQEIANRFVNDDGSYPDVLNKIRPIANENSPMIWYGESKDTLQLMTFLKSFPSLEGHEIPSNKLKLKWGIANKDGQHPLYLVKTNRLGEPEMDGDIITSATQNYDQIGNPVVSIIMTESAKLKWEMLTTKALKNNFQIAIVLNDMVYSAPGVSSTISGGRSQISADFTQDEASRLASTLDLGYLPKMELISYDEIMEENK